METVEYVGAENYKRTLDDPKFYKALSNTFVYVVGSVLCIFTACFPVSCISFRMPANSARNTCLLSAYTRIGFARSDVEAFLSFFPWQGRGIEPISGDTTWFRTDQLDDGS